MIIDLLLDRYDGEPYNATKFYHNVREYENELGIDYISIALDYGNNNDVIHALKRYLKDYGYNMQPGFISWLCGQKWIDEEDIFKSDTRWDVNLYANGEPTYNAKLTADQITMVIEYIKELEER